jgi:hypothetical protein
MKLLFTVTISFIVLATVVARAGERSVLPGVPPVTSGNDSQTVTIARSGSQTPTKGPAEYFTGSVRVDPLFSAHDPSHVSGAYVTFEPGARSAWHVHPFGQTLVVTGGTGWVQQWGGHVEVLGKAHV